MTLTDTDLDAILKSMDKYDDCTSLKDSLREVIAELRDDRLQALNNVYTLEARHQNDMEDLKYKHIQQMFDLDRRRQYELADYQAKLDQAMKVIEKGIASQPPPPIIIQAEGFTMATLMDAKFERLRRQRAAGRMLYRPNPHS